MIFVTSRVHRENDCFGRVYT